MAYGHKTEHRLRVRAQVVLHAARGRSHACIAGRPGYRTRQAVERTVPFGLICLSLVTVW